MESNETTVCSACKVSDQTYDAKALHISGMVRYLVEKILCDQHGTDGEAVMHCVELLVDEGGLGGRSEAADEAIDDFLTDEIEID